MRPSEPLLKTNAPDWLELLLYDAGEFYQLTAYNAMNAYYVADAVNVEIQAQISREPKEVINACNDMPVEFSFCDGVVTVKAGMIKSFAMFIIR